MITVNSRRYDGTIKKSWRCELLERRDSLLICVGEFDSDIEHSDLGGIKKGTVSYEFFWLDRWYNIFRFHEPSGELRNYYCNICMPPNFSDGILDYVDLDVDVLIAADLSQTVLDREEFDQNALAFNYPGGLKIQVEKALHEVTRLFEDRGLPDVPELFATSTAALRESREL